MRVRVRVRVMVKVRVRKTTEVATCHARSLKHGSGYRRNEIKQALVMIFLDLRETPRPVLGRVFRSGFIR